MVKRGVALGAVVFLFGVHAGPARADYAKGTTMFQLYGGGAALGGRYDLPAGDDEKDYADGGSLLGGQFLYFIQDTPCIALGMDISHAGFSSHDSTALIPNRYTESSARDTVGVLTARLSYPKGRVRPYVQGGLGVHQTSLRLEATPINGTSWSDTATMETRDLYDGGHVGPAVEGAVGVYLYLAQQLFVGVEYKVIGLFGPDFKPTAAGVQQGLGSTAGSVAESGIGFMLGWGF